MSRDARWKALLELLVERGRLEVEQAAVELDVSAATIRRDFRRKYHTRRGHEMPVPAVTLATLDAVQTVPSHYSLSRCTCGRRWSTRLAYSFDWRTIRGNGRV